MRWTRAGKKESTGAGEGGKERELGRGAEMEVERYRGNRGQAKGVAQEC